MKTKRGNIYSRNEDGTVNIHLDSGFVAIIDFEDVLLCKLETFTLRKCNKHLYVMHTTNTKLESGKYKTTHVTLAKYLTGKKSNRYLDKNPLNNKRSNII